MTNVNNQGRETIVETKTKHTSVLWGLAIVASIVVFGGVCTLTGCDSGSAGDTTPAGTPPTQNPPPVEPSDPNGEGVRSDVRQYIETTYPDSAKTRAALFQYAKVVEKALADANDKELSIQHAEEAGRALECVTYVLDDDVQVSYSTYQDLRPVILNTDERNKAYFTYNDQLGGQVFKSVPYDERASACDIDPSTLSN